MRLNKRETNASPSSNNIKEALKMLVKFSPNEYVLKFRNGKIVDEGIGLSFFNYSRKTTACAIPVSSTDMDFIFEEVTQDYQTVSIQGQLSCCIADYKKAASSFDFTVDLNSGKHKDTPIQKLTKRMLSISQVLIKNSIGSIDLSRAVQSSRPIADQVLREMQSNEECRALGVAVAGFSILMIKAKPETARALEAKTRERILKESDDALYERRNASIDQERKVKENELNTEKSVEEKKKAIKETELETKRMVLESNNELEKIATCSEIDRDRLKLEAQIELERKRSELVDLRLENAKKDADAEAYRIGAIMEAYNKLSSEVLVALATINMEPEKIIAQAFNNLASNSEKIGTLNITPDLLESLKVSGK